MSQGQSVPGPSHPVHSKGRSFIQRTAWIAGILAGLCVLLVLTLSLWNLAVTKWQHTHNSVPGNFYTVDGRLLHLYCSGTGSPTIAIEAGASANSLGWQGVQPKLFAIDARLHLRSCRTWLEPASRWPAGCRNDCSGTACVA